ncbi:MAG TPA: twin-arginine translocation signal domain-containing protein, partial [Gemmatimonadales bacterium]|nr:twin-arginine translocation signal domain-containing protein [Gemmatimonadales bacterium]
MLTRRGFLRLLSAAAGVAAIGAASACAGPPAAPTSAPTAVKPTEAAQAPAATAAPAAKPAGAGEAKPSGTVTVVQGSEIRSLDVSIEIAIAYRNAMMHLYDQLLFRNEKM